MSAESYTNEIKSLDAEIKRLNDHIKRLRLQRKTANENLYKYMIRHNLQKIGDGKQAITLSKCAPPKPRTRVKPKRERHEQAIELFREVGIPDPEEFYLQFEATQKNVSGEAKEQPIRKPTKNDVDFMLGF